MGGAAQVWNTGGMVETLAFGYGLLEGPRPDPDGGLYFSDVTKGGVYRRAADGTIAVVVPKRRGVGGIALHADGGIVISGRNVCHVRDGQTRVLFQQEDIPGFNDICVDGAGRVYTGSMRDNPFSTEPVRVTGEAYRIDAEGEAVQLYDGVALTNGIGFSPDGARLYHADTTEQVIRVHDVVDGDVVAESGGVFAHVDGFPDGLAVDEAGGVWVALYGGGGVRRFSASGEPDRDIAVPARGVTSLCFAGPDLDELIVVTEDNTDDESRGGTIFRVPAADVGAVGVPAPLARI
jgi:xylono-1,5-lactonase